MFYSFFVCFISCFSYFSLCACSAFNPFGAKMEIVCTACIKKRALVLAVSALYASLRLCEAAPTLSLSHTVIYGPAVHPKRCSLPVNYFYVQAKDTDGNKYS